MSHVEITHWTCDRCGRTFTQPTYDGAAKAGLPTGWLDIDVRNVDRSIYRHINLCEECHKSFLEWRYALQGMPVKNERA